MNIIYLLIFGVGISTVVCALTAYSSFNKGFDAGYKMAKELFTTSFSSSMNEKKDENT